MKEQTQLIGILQNLLDQQSSQKTKKWWEKYLKDVIPFRGVGIPDIREQLAIWRSENGIEDWTEEEQLEIALRLFEQPFAEDKLAGMLFLQYYLYDKLEWQGLLERYEDLYIKGLISDWNISDWFCVRVLGPTIAKYGDACARAIASWRRSENLWQARSSIVAFVKVSSCTRYYPLIIRSCKVLIKREERFAKTSVGWIMRDISKYDKDLVERFIKSHIEHFSPESLRNALKYFNKNEQKSYLQRLMDV